MARAKGSGGTGAGGKASVRKKPPYNLKTRIISQLRRLFLWHPGLKEVRARTKAPKGHQCEGCHEVYPAREMRCDHLVPVVPVTGFTDWNDYVARMFAVIPEGIQHLCLGCHDAKTVREREARVAHRRQQKENAA